MIVSCVGHQAVQTLTQRGTCPPVIIPEYQTTERDSELETLTYEFSSLCKIKKKRLQLCKKK